MPIKKRKTTKTYDDFRRERWKFQGGATKVDFRSSKNQDGTALEFATLQPKEHAFYKDIWHCGTSKDARALARLILEFGNVDYLEFKGSWVWVSWRDDGNWKLPGQDPDDREKVYG